MKRFHPRFSPMMVRRSMLVKRLTLVIRATVLRVLRAQTEEVAARSARGEHSLPPDWKERWSLNFRRALQGPVINLMAQGSVVARREELHKKAIGDPSEIAISVVSSRYEPVQRWLEEVASSTTARNAAKINSLFLGLGEEFTPGEMAKYIRTMQETWDMNRANMIATTTANWSFNEGVRQQYTADGVQVFQWWTAEDDAVCPFCAAMHGQMVRATDPFWDKGSTMLAVVDDEGGLVVGARKADEDQGQKIQRMRFPSNIMHPPLHPFCACTILPSTQAELSVAGLQQAPAPETGGSFVSSILVPAVEQVIIGLGG